MTKIAVTGPSGKAGRYVVRDLLAEVFPGVPLRRPVGDFETLLSLDKARQLLGYAPQHSWRNHIN